MDADLDSRHRTLRPDRRPSEVLPGAGPVASGSRHHPAAQRRGTAHPGGKQALLGFVREARWLHYARKSLHGLFLCLPGQPGYNKRLRKLAATMAG